LYTEDANDFELIASNASPWGRGPQFRYSDIRWLGTALLHKSVIPTMPRPARHSFAFEPEHIEAMRKAFDAVCAKLELSTGTGDHKTELVARRIIELAIAGERDADSLTAHTLAEFGARTTDRCGGTRRPIP
jgi:hypothetical protein